MTVSAWAWPTGTVNGAWGAHVNSVLVPLQSDTADTVRVAPPPFATWLASDEAASLCYGHQRKLEIARALASEPRLLLLDEPGAGMNPSEIVEIMQLIRDIRDKGVSVLLIEHHMRLVMGISDYVVVLEFGNKIAEGVPEEIRANPKVRAAYLGNPD